jgi:hypothetical protein
VVPIAEVLRSGADLDAWRNYVQQMNRYLAGHPAAQPRSLSKEEHELLTNQCGLNQSELAELASATFTPLDAHYLELVYVLRDTARSLKLDAMTPLERARQGFAWVVREVRLQEGDNVLLPPLPVLRRGWGTSQERALIFLALLDQLGIDGCMIGLPAGMSAQNPLRDWVPGALIEKDIYLFDTRLGLPLPGPVGKGIATLAQARAGLDLRQLLKGEEKYPYDVGPEDARHAEIQVAFSLPSLAPRMEFLQNFLADNEKINFWVDPVRRLKHFQEVAGTVQVWNSPAGANNPLRVLRAYLPPEEGGVAQVPLRDLVRQQVVPWQDYPKQLATLAGEPGQRLRMLFAAPFLYINLETRMPEEFLVVWLPGISEESADKPGTRRPAENLLRSPLPRDLMLHGRISDAVALLVAIQGELERQRARHINDKLEEAVRTWSKNAIQAYADLIRAEQEPGKPRAAQAKARVDQLWGRDSAPVMALLQTSAAEPMLERVVYLLALCKHEQAQGLQVQCDQDNRRNKTVTSSADQARTEAWKSAANWWGTYLNEHAAAPFAPAARLQRAQALQALGKRAEAIALLEDLTGVSTNLEKTARLYLAKQLKTR